MRLLEVVTPTQAREFVDFPVRLYAGDPNYVRPLNRDVENVFDRAANSSFHHGNLIRWLLVDLAGHILGRVAAFGNEQTAHTFAQPTGGMGFFECSNNQEATSTLFDVCRAWLLVQGMAAMDGPINFGARDQWWGLLLDNFGPPQYVQNYNPLHYRRLLESHCFHCYFNQYTYFRKQATPLLSAYLQRVKGLLHHSNYTLEHLRLSNLPKYAEDFRQVHNKAGSSATA